MAISFIGSGSAAAGTTTLSVPYKAPADPPITQGELLVLDVIGRKSITAPDPSASGFGTPGGFNNWGIVVAFDDYVGAAVLVRIADGTESGNLSVTTTDYTSSIGKIRRYTNGTGLWITNASGGIGNVGAGTTIQPNDPGIADDDFVAWAVGAHETGFQFNDPVISQSGATFATPLTREDVETANGPGCHATFTDCEVTGGPGTGQMSFGYLSSDEAGGVAAGVILRMREGAADEFEKSVGDTITVAVSETPAIEVDLSVADSAAVAVTELPEIVVTQTGFDTVPIEIFDSVTVTTTEDEKSVQDTAIVGLAESLEITVTLSIADTATVLVTDEVTVFALNQNIGLSDTATVAITETLFLTTTLVVEDTATVAVADEVTVFTLNENINVADTATVAITDQVSVVETEDVVNVFDQAAVAINESPLVRAQFSVADTATVAVADAVSVFELTQNINVNDTATVSVADSVSVFVPEALKSVADTATVGLADTVAITVTVFRLDIAFVGLSESISLAITAQVDDTATVAVNDAVSVEVTFIPGNPQIRRFSQVSDIWPIAEGSEGIWIA